MRGTCSYINSPVLDSSGPCRSSQTATTTGAYWKSMSAAEAEPWWLILCTDGGVASTCRQDTWRTGDDNSSDCDMSFAACRSSQLEAGKAELAEGILPKPLFGGCTRLGEVCLLRAAPPSADGGATI
eukprot:CAMPEP_0197669060 /NCGR_PEP_ID=MMETSP1338-20131121/71021_1 /TAXON_ID=43686 ORGANISM="Pelagodinium beii, Strain RCC1491" /NCGR_SAMPLE_ID=MMETSP1338 /ASSEMBLY_ACC=CAM_ASM_000754 /LENGTH=126 /DNA_ID=CAMNT_0043248549 /DNA_START=19 /DNA_END=399 /DNA_ORIENTATION=+